MYAESSFFFRVTCCLSLLEDSCFLSFTFLPTKPLKCWLFFFSWMYPPPLQKVYSWGRIIGEPSVCLDWTQLFWWKGGFVWGIPYCFNSFPGELPLTARKLRSLRRSSSKSRDPFKKRTDLIYGKFGFFLYIHGTFEMENFGWFRLVP